MKITLVKNKDCRSVGYLGVSIKQKYTYVKYGFNYIYSGVVNHKPGSIHKSVKNCAIRPCFVI